MQKVLIPALAALVMLCGQIPAIADDDETPVSLNAEISFLNMYVWRGMRLTDGPVMQPSATLSIGGFSANVWANMDLDDVNGEEYTFSEVDYTAGYALSLGAFELFAGALIYTYPGTDYASTTEIFAGFSVDGPLEPTITLYRDIDQIEGFFVTFGLTHALEIEGTDGVINLFAEAGWGDEDYTRGYFGAGKNALTDFIVGGDLTMGLMDGVRIAPYLAWSSLVDSVISDLYAEPDSFIYGGKVLIEF